MFKNARQKSVPWSRPLADLVGPAIDPVLARQGFSESSIVLYWEEIVGERLATMSEPLCLRWPPRGKNPAETQPATLVVRVEGGFALELQHLSAVIIERVNAYLGFGCVGRIALKQGPLQSLQKRKAPRRPPSDAAVAAAEALTQGVSETALRQALTRLGAHVLEPTLAVKSLE